MEKTKQKIEYYIRSNLDVIINKRRSSMGKLLSVKDKWTYDMSKFTEDFEQNIKQIILSNKIEDQDSIKELMLFAGFIFKEKLKEFKNC